LSYNFKINFNIYSGKDFISYLLNYLKIEKKLKPIILVDHSIYKFKLITKLLSILKKKYKYLDIEKTHFKPEPTYELLKIKTKYYRGKKDVIVAIGGGSTIDFAKGLAITLKNNYEPISFRGFPKNLNKPLPVIAIPSTFNTGSEVVFNAVFTDDHNKIKLGINYSKNYPSLGILVPELIKKLPKRIIFYSAYSVFVRSIETFYSKKANLISRFFSKQSFELVIESFFKILNNHNGLENYMKLQLSGIYSMIALSNVGGGIGGLGSYYLSVNYSIPQAIGYGISANEIFKENYKIKRNIYQSISEKIDVKKYIIKFDNLLKKYYKKKKLIKKTKEDLKINLYQVYKKNKKNINFLNPCKLNDRNIKNFVTSIVDKL